MSESRIRLLSQLSSSIFSFDSTPNSIHPLKKSYSRNSSFTNPKVKLNENSVNHSLDLRPNTSTRSLSKDELLTPRLRKQLDLNIYSTENFPKPDEAKVETIEVTGLRPYDNEKVLKSIAQKYHVVEVNTEFDNLKGVCTGNGKIVIRSFQSNRDRNELVCKLKNKGFDVKEAKIVPKPKITHPFLTFDSSLRSRRVGDRSICSKENMSRNLTPRYMHPTTSSSRKFL